MSASILSLNAAALRARKAYLKALAHRDAVFSKSPEGSPARGEAANALEVARIDASQANVRALDARKG